MKRIDIIYGGHFYSVGGRELEDLQAEILTGLERGTHWLRVNDGEGLKRDALLLITPATSIALVPIPAEQRDFEHDAPPIEDPDRPG